VKEKSNQQPAVTYNTNELVRQRAFPTNQTKTAFAWPTKKFDVVNNY